MKRCFPCLALLLPLILFWNFKTHAAQVLSQTTPQDHFHHQLWHQVVSTYVNRQGWVDACRLRENQGALNRYLHHLASVSPETHPMLFTTRDERLAYWLNAHNAHALKQVLLHPGEPVLKGTTQSGQTPVILGGRMMTLPEIRQHIFREFGRQPEITAALTNFTVAQPPLYYEAYDPARLETQLEAQHRRTSIIQASRTASEAASIRLRLLPAINGFATIPANLR